MREEVPFYTGPRVAPADLVQRLALSGGTAVGDSPVVRSMRVLVARPPASVACRVRRRHDGLGHRRGREPDMPTAVPAAAGPVSLGRVIVQGRSAPELCLASSRAESFPPQWPGLPVDG